MNKILRYTFSLITFLFIGTLNCAFAKTPTIVVSIKPIHSIVSQVTQGIATPKLLLPDGASPHTFMLKPSDRHQIGKADLLIWVGQNCETNLTKIMQQYPQKSLSLMSIAELTLYPLRTDRDFSINHHAHDEHHHHHHHGHDAHIWLSIENAKVITQTISNKLQEIDPENKNVYDNNAKQYIQKLQTLKSKLSQRLEKKTLAPFLVFHDAYQYFEKEFNIESIGSILINPHVPLSPKSMAQIQTLINKHNVACVYYEPEFSYQPLKPLLNKMGLTLLELDPLGIHQAAGVDCYENVLEKMTEQLLQCHHSPQKQD